MALLPKGAISVPPLHWKKGKDKLAELNGLNSELSVFTSVGLDVQI